MLTFIVFIVALMALVIGVIFIIRGDDAELRTIGVVVVVVAVLVGIWSCAAVVGTRNVGVVTTFGAPTGRTLDNGLHFKAPWQSVTDIDGTVQTQKFVGHKANENTGALGCISVRIADGSTACVSTVIRTEVDDDHADDIYADYRNSDKDINDAVNDALVRTQLTSALASTFRNFNPLLVPGSVADSQATEQAAPDLQGYAGDVKDEMRSRLEAQSKDGKPEVDVRGLTISYIYLSESTQTRLNQLQAEVAKTRIAKQEQATATARKTANDNLRSSLTDEVLVQQCIAVLEARTEKRLSIPAGFSCWPGGSGGVVIPAAK